ncbi:hypothetical protein G7K_0579-t1 [Saitoella complicata NRRL Y-17804]|uniref:Uncharacterized protein n=1 Tax=Saitoella complicata (strain BCRC 22490 / CBS 7301 / JCM 7358 / NBRC 10748 / NRRL Y-17804) TaxID=698492 RepID=A0A0E9N8X6_SAICN|nr:hypothetical protein G7K_0579-t1 [Saitoella complicata NRRL Y-17804]
MCSNQSRNVTINCIAPAIIKTKQAYEFRPFQSSCSHLTTLICHHRIHLTTPSTRLLVHTLTLSNLHRALPTGSVHGVATHSLLNLPSHCQESLLDVGSALCTGFEEGNAESISEFLESKISTF